MATHTFFCVDGHTCGNPVRMVAGGGPVLHGKNMVEKRAHFEAEFDWIRTGLMFEPRGHDMMSGTILYPPTRDDCDIAFLFIETSGCLPMCGHGTIGTVTMALERGLVSPKTPGVLNIDTPAGKVVATYVKNGDHIDSVRITNVASFLHSTGLSAHVDGLGEVVVDVAYGGNFYAIIDPQLIFSGIEAVNPSDLLRWSPKLRDALNAKYRFVHPDNPAINGLRHLLWAGAARHSEAHARNAVFYGDKALDRSPCGTGTSARIAQWAAKGKLQVQDDFIHESIIGTLFRGRVEAETQVGPIIATHDTHIASNGTSTPAIIPSIEGWARLTGYNTIFIDDRDPLAHGFSLKD
jgi:4-hydroxyproline epimerase